MNNEKKTILIAESDTFTRNLLGTVFPKSDYEILLATRGIEAAAYLKTHTPTVAILEAGLPEVDGINLCGRMKRIKRLQTCIVIILTTTHDERLADAARIGGANAVVAKPRSSPAFKTMVFDLIRRHALAPIQEFEIA